MLKISLQVDSLIIKINQNIPRISPMGMFEVSPRLFPAVLYHTLRYYIHILLTCLTKWSFTEFFSQLIGATITYVLVIAQFAASY